MTFAGKIVLLAVGIGTLVVLIAAFTVGRRTKKNWKPGEYYYNPPDNMP